MNINAARAMVEVFGFSLLPMKDSYRLRAANVYDGDSVEWASK